MGNCTLKQLPLPGWLDTSIIPWCSSTNSLTNDKPIPDDGCNMLYLASVSNLWKRDFCLPGSIPIPSSITDMVTFSVSVVMRTVTAFPEGVYLNALESRLKNIFSNLSRSIHIYSSLQSVSTLQSICFSSATNWKLSVILRSRAIISLSSTNNFIFLFCIFRKSNIWFTNRSMRSVFLCTKVRCSRALDERGSFSSISVTGLAISVSGVRSS